MGASFWEPAEQEMLEPEKESERRRRRVMRDADADAGGSTNCGDSQGDHSCPGGADTAAAPAGGAPRAHASGSGRDATSVARGPGMRPHVFTLSVPFPTPLEAEIARGSLAPDAEPHQRVVGKNLAVSGRILAVRWEAEDCRLLRISVINFLDHLSLVVHTMQHFGPPISR
ncbi:EKC/KEOPS complex subunit LAGE3-like isoform X1 [Papio anubis]|nr:EKC/KEOPS complex subunit LAGE3-like isoform X1 [Papio anubis]